MCYTNRKTSGSLSIHKIVTVNLPFHNLSVYVFKENLDTSIQSSLYELSTKLMNYKTCTHTHACTCQEPLKTNSK